MALLNGIDVATSQASLDLKHAREALDLDVVYVKLGGDNVGRYVAPHYAEEVDDARKAGFPYVGHYWVPGKQDPTGAADYFVDHLRGFSKKTDFVVLDNETLDRGKLYGDTDATRFCERVMKRLGIPASQVLVYIGASVLRSARWPRLEKLGVGVLVASYGRNTGKRDHEPVMAGRFRDRWAAHQYTSNGRVPGFPGVVDLNVFQKSFFEAWAPKKPSAAKPETKPSKPAPAKPDAPHEDELAAMKKKAAKLLQTWARRGGYHGPVDGVLGIQSWKGIQTLLAKGYDYDGRIDGVPAELTYQALQRLARKGGYTGPIDGELAIRSWTGVAKALGA